MVLQQIAVSFITRGVSVRWNFTSLPLNIFSDNVVGVNGKQLIRIDYNQKQTRICLYRMRKEKSERYTCIKLA